MDGRRGFLLTGGVKRYGLTFPFLLWGDLGSLGRVWKPLPLKGQYCYEKNWRTTIQPRPNFLIVAVQLLSHVQLFVTPWTAACQASLSFTISWSLLKLMSIESVMPSNHLTFCCPLLLLPSVFPSIRVFFNESALLSGGQSIGASGSASVLPMNIQDWFPLGWTDLISLQSKGLSRIFSNTTVQKHQFFSTQPSALSFLYDPTLTSIHDYWKNHSFDEMDIVGKVMSLIFNMLSRLVIPFFPRSKHLLILWL